MTFIGHLFNFYSSFHFAYLEINPLVVGERGDSVLIAPLDMAAKLDECAKFECSKDWGIVEFPPPFGRKLSEEEIAVQGTPNSAY